MPRAEEDSPEQPRAGSRETTPRRSNGGGIWRPTFALTSALERRVGGLRPGRIFDGIGRRAYPAYAESDWNWYEATDRLQFRLNPYYHIDRQVVRLGSYEASLTTFMRRTIHPGMTTIDAGANFGYFTVLMAQRVGPTGRVHAFEPLSHLRRRCAENLARNALADRVTLHHEALGDRDAELTFSFAAPEASNQGMGSLKLSSHPMLAEHQTVPVRQLDSLASDLALERLDFLKADIQGAEIDMLAGAAETIREFRPMMVLEFSPPEQAAAGRTCVDLADAVIGLGYELHALRDDGTMGERLDRRAFEDSSPSDNVVCLPTPR